MASKMNIKTHHSSSIQASGIFAVAYVACVNIPGSSICCYLECHREHSWCQLCLTPFAAKRSTRCIEQGVQHCVAKSPEDASFCAIALFFIVTINKLSPSTRLKMIHNWLLAPLALECVHICAVTLTAPPIWQESLVIANHGAAQHQFWPMAINRKGLCQMVKTVHSRTSHH